MNIYDTIRKRRTIRQFKKRKVPSTLLKRCVNAARLAPSGANLQPLEYIIIDDKKADYIFPLTRWAGYLSDGCPKKEKEPKAYIIILNNRDTRSSGFKYDAGIAAENIILTALEKGVGSCILGSIDRKKIKKLLKIPQKYTVCIAIALGYPDECPVKYDSEKDIKYWKDKDGRLHVPKRKIKDILHKNQF